MDDFGERIPVPVSITRYPKVILLRTQEAMGVAGARMAGAEEVGTPNSTFINTTQHNTTQHSTT